MVYRIQESVTIVNEQTLKAMQPTKTEGHRQVCTTQRVQNSLRRFNATRT